MATPTKPPPTPIWANDKKGLDPKRSHRFVLYLSGVPAYFVKSTTVPSFTIGDGGKHVFLGHEFKFPGSVKWAGTIDIKMVDTIDYNMSQKFLNYVRKAGYVYPSKFNESSTDPEYFRKTISKAKFQEIFGQVKIQRIDADGNVYETWVLNNAWINKADFGSADYNSEGLVDFGVSFTYDWAELREGDEGNPPAFPKEI